MPIGLSLNEDLWRVVIALSGLNDAVNSVHVERSANEVLWSTVRGGTALPISSGAGSLDDYEYLAHADGSIDTHYRVTTVDPAPGMLLDGSGDYASTPDDASLDITGDLVLTWYGKLDDWEPASTQALINKYVGPDDRSYRLVVNDSGFVQVDWSTDGDAGGPTVASTIQPTPNEDGSLAVRAFINVDVDGTDHRVSFWTSPTGEEGTWVTLEHIDDTGTTSIHAGDAELRIGADGGGNGISGITFWASVFSGNISGGDLLTGTVVADPDFTAEESGTSSFDDSAGRTWTLQGDAEIVSFETDSIAVTQEAYVAKSIRFPLLNRAVKIGDYSDLERPAQLGVHAVTGRSFPIGTTDVNSSVRFQMEFVTETEDEARRLKLLLALGDILYLQSPAEVNTRRPPRSMYVVADSSAVGRIGTGTYRRHTVPFTEVAAPSPLVTGATLTWAHVFAQFGNWHQLITASPSWFDLLSTVGDPDDLVVL